MTAYSTTTHVAFVSKKSFLRGWLAGEVLLPLVDLDLHSSVALSPESAALPI